MYDKSGFLQHFSTGGASPNTCATYRSFLNRIDDAVGGLDEMLAAKGLEGVMQWSRTTDVEPFGTYRSHARSVLKRYAVYRLDCEDMGDTVAASVVEIRDSDDCGIVDTDANFIREKEMQVQVRRQLAMLEAGLVAIDNGVEEQVVTGRIDILARDAQGNLVVIELKAGKCPTGALEQLLGYAYDVEQQRQEAVRPMLVAGSFNDRIRAAARRSGVDLRTYAYSLSFQPDS